MIVGRAREPHEARRSAAAKVEHRDVRELVHRGKHRELLHVRQAISSVIRVESNGVRAEIDQVRRARSVDVGHADAARIEGVLAIDLAHVRERDVRAEAAVPEVGPVLDAVVAYGAQSRGSRTHCLRFVHDLAIAHARLVSGWGLASAGRDSSSRWTPLGGFGYSTGQRCISSSTAKLFGATASLLKNGISFATRLFKTHHKRVMQGFNARAFTVAVYRNAFRKLNFDYISDPTTI